MKFLCVWWGGGHFYDSKQAGGGVLCFPPCGTFSEVPYFPIFHVSTSLILGGGGEVYHGGLGCWGLGGMVHKSLKSEV